MKRLKYILVGAALAILFTVTTAQDGTGGDPGAMYYGQHGSMDVERLASRVERFMKLHVEIVRNQMELRSLQAKALELQIKGADDRNNYNGHFSHISDSTYFDTRTGEIILRERYKKLY